MGGLGIPSEKTSERISEILSRAIRKTPHSEKITREEVYASIVLSGGEAYAEDIKWILEKFFGHRIEKIEDLEDLLMSYRDDGLRWEWDIKRGKDYWKVDRILFKKYQQEIEERMRKALGYQKSGLEALFSKEEEGKEIDLWKDYKGQSRRSEIQA